MTSKQRQDLMKEVTESTLKYIKLKYPELIPTEYWTDPNKELKELLDSIPFRHIDGKDWIDRQALEDKLNKGK